MKILFDMSSFIWRGLLAGKDPDGMTVEHEGKKVHVNSAAWGYENTVSLMLGAFKDAKLTPVHAVLIFEGLSSKGPRRMIDKTYKEGDTRPDEAYGEFHKVKERMMDMWRKLGACLASQDYVEGDDVLGWFSQNLREDMRIATYDWDLMALSTPANQHGAKVEVWVDGQVDINKFGLFDFDLITTYKALVGDSSDNIKGCVDFGKKSFEDFCTTYGFDGLRELHNMLAAGALAPELHEMAQEMEDVGVRKPKLKVKHPLIRMICDQEQQVVRCFKLAKIYPEWVNTRERPLKLTPGIVLESSGVEDERVKKWYGQKYLVTADNYTDAVEFMQRQAAQSAFLTFDIETSSADESDEWLAAKGDPDGVDALGSTLTGFSITAGDNLQHTVYVSVDHADTDNIRMSEARRFLEAVLGAAAAGSAATKFTLNGKDVVIHNTHFELPVLYLAEDEDGTLWRDHWADNGYHGFLPRALDTKLEASYVNENTKLGLKHRSLTELEYKQDSYDDVTILMEPNLRPGGRHLGYKSVEVRPAVTEQRPIPGDPNGAYELVTVEPALIESREIRRYKMKELTAEHVFNYGCDDTICTAALHVYYQLVMQLEGVWEVYKAVEIGAAYQHAKNFVDGMAFSLERSKELEREDDVVFEQSWGTLRQYLISKGWEGTVPPTYTPKIDAAQIKEAWAIVNPDIEWKDACSAPMTRTPSKLVKLLQAGGEMVFSSMLAKCLEGEEGAAAFTAYVLQHFKGDPVFNAESPKQMTHLLYEVMGLPIQIRNKPTDIMKAKGLPGNPKTDELAVKYAMRVATPEIKTLLESVWLMKMVQTRRELYYSKYPYCVHWKTGRIHTSHNQCATNTRRASESDPNKQQLPKHVKVELSMLTEDHLKAAIVPRFRETILPHKPGAVVVSMDFNAQELRNIADQSGDPDLTACYVGDKKKDMHSITGHAILKLIRPEHKDMTYDEFDEYYRRTELDKEFKNSPIGKLVKDFRGRGKKTNFTTEYGAMAPKLAATMLVTEEEAQMFIDARESAFPRVAEWKKEIIEEARRNGFVCTMLGARRHLRELLDSDNYTEVSKAERQAVNFKVQGSCGEQTKLAESRMWDTSLFFRYDAVCYGPIHDECVASVMVDENFLSFLREMHACMVAPYANQQVPIVSSISFGPNFGVQYEVGEEPTQEAMQAGLDAMERARLQEEAVA